MEDQTLLSWLTRTHLLLLTLLSATATSAVMWQQKKKDGKAIKFAHASRKELSVQSQLAWIGNEMAF